MTVYVNVGGVIHTATGTLTIAETPSKTPIVPMMTGASQSGFVVSATSEYSESGTTASAWKAFNGVTGNGWAVGWSSTAAATGGSPQVLQVDLPEVQTCTSYTLTNRSDANTVAPTAWEFQGWTSGGGWVTLDTQAAVSWANGEVKEFNITTPGAYLHYRWRFTGSGALCQVAEAQLWA